jgi:hypothetical protein
MRRMRFHSRKLSNLVMSIINDDYRLGTSAASRNRMMHPTEKFSSNMVNIPRIWSIYSNMVNIIPLVQHFFSLPLGTNWLQIC